MFDIDDLLHFHGVFMEIFGKGVLLKGQSGIGKSELALSLMDRGNFLVSDDSVVFSVSDCGHKVVGRPPDTLKDLLEIRGLGILNVRHLLGDNALKKEAFLDLILHLVPESFETAKITHPFEPLYSQKIILNRTIPEITLSLLPERNIALVVETAVKYHQQKLTHPTEYYAL
jgi:HPr kinase/phosphorylase